MDASGISGYKSSLTEIYSSSSNGNPPSYQCVMMPQQIQFVPQQFQVVPTNQHMIVNSQGQVHSLSTFRVYFKMVYSVYSR